jgi:hypothetical protein
MTRAAVEEACTIAMAQAAAATAFFFQFRYIVPPLPIGRRERSAALDARSRALEAVVIRGRASAHT